MGSVCVCEFAVFQVECQYAHSPNLFCFYCTCIRPTAERRITNSHILNYIPCASRIFECALYLVIHGQIGKYLYTYIECVNLPQRHEANTFYSTCRDRQFPLIRSGRVKDVLTISKVRTQFPRYLPKSEHMPEGVNKCILQPCRSQIQVSRYFIANSSTFISNAYRYARKCFCIYNVFCVSIYRYLERRIKYQIFLIMY